MSKKIETKMPSEHQKTYNAFKKIVKSGELDNELLDIYEEESEKASVLLKIFRSERKNRGRFTYNVNANANIPYAKKSNENARQFISILKAIIETS